MPISSFSPLLSRHGSGERQIEQGEESSPTLSSLCLEEEKPSLSTEQMTTLLWSYDASLKGVEKSLEVLFCNGRESPLTDERARAIKNLVNELGKGCDLLLSFHEPHYCGSLWFLISKHLPFLNFQGKDETMDRLSRKLLDIDLLRQLIDQKINLDTWGAWLNKFPFHPTFLEESVKMHATPLIWIIGKAWSENLIIRPPGLLLFKLSYSSVVGNSPASSEESIKMIIDFLWLGKDESYFASYLDQFFTLVLPPSPYSTHFPHLLSILEQGLTLKRGQFYLSVVTAIYQHLPRMQEDQIKQSRNFLEVVSSQQRHYLAGIERANCSSGGILRHAYPQMLEHTLSSFRFRQNIPYQYTFIVDLCPKLVNMGAQGEEIVLESILPIIPELFSSEQITAEECKNLLKELYRVASQVESSSVREKILYSLHAQLVIEKLQPFHYTEISHALCDFSLDSSPPIYLDSLSFVLCQIGSRKERGQILKRLYKKVIQEPHFPTRIEAWHSLFSLFKKCQPYYLEIARWLHTFPRDAFLSERVDAIRLLFFLSQDDDYKQYMIIEPLFSLLKFEEHQEKVRKIFEIAVERWNNPFLPMHVGQKLCEVLSPQTFLKKDLSIINFALQKFTKGYLKKGDLPKQHPEELALLFTNLSQMLSSPSERRGLEENILETLCLILPWLPFDPSHAVCISRFFPASFPISEQMFEAIADFAHKMPLEESQWRYRLLDKLCDQKPSTLSWEKFFGKIFSILSQCKRACDTDTLPLSIIKKVFALSPRKCLEDKQKIAQIFLSHAKSDAERGRSSGYPIVETLYRQLLQLPCDQRKPLETLILSQGPLLSQNYVQLLSSFIIHSPVSYFPAEVVITMIKNLPMEKEAQLRCIEQCGFLVKSRPIAQQDYILEEVGPSLLIHLIEFTKSWKYARRSQIYQRMIGLFPKFFLSPQGAAILEKILLQEQAKEDLCLQLEIIKALQRSSQRRGKSAEKIRLLLASMVGEWSASTLQRIVQQLIPSFSKFSEETILNISIFIASQRKEQNDFHCFVQMFKSFSLPLFEKIFASFSEVAERLPILNQLCQEVFQKRHESMRQKILDFLFSQLLSEQFSSQHSVEIANTLSHLPFDRLPEECWDTILHILSQIDTKEGKEQAWERLYQKWGEIPSRFLSFVQHSVSQSKKEDEQYTIIFPFCSLVPKLSLTDRNKAMKWLETIVIEWKDPAPKMRVSQKFCDLTSERFSKEALRLIRNTLRTSQPRESVEDMQKLTLLTKLSEKLSPTSIASGLDNEIKALLLSHLLPLPFDRSHLAIINRILRSSSSPLPMGVFTDIVTFSKQVPSEESPWLYELVDTLCDQKPLKVPLQKFFSDIFSILSQCTEYDEPTSLSIVEKVLVLSPEGFFEAQKKIVEVVLSHAATSVKQSSCSIVEKLCHHLFRLRCYKHNSLKELILSQIPLLSQEYTYLLSLFSAAYTEEGSSFVLDIVMAMLEHVSKMDETAKSSFTKQVIFLMKKKSTKQGNKVVEKMVSSPDLSSSLPEILEMIQSWDYSRLSSICWCLVNSLCSLLMLEQTRESESVMNFLSQGQAKKDSSLQLHLARTLQGLYFRLKKESLRSFIADRVESWNSSTAQEVRAKLFSPTSYSTEDKEIAVFLAIRAKNKNDYSYIKQMFRLCSPPPLVIFERMFSYESPSPDRSVHYLVDAARWMEGFSASLQKIAIAQLFLKDHSPTWARIANQLVKLTHAPSLLCQLIEHLVQTLSILKREENSFVPEFEDLVADAIVNRNRIYDEKSIVKILKENNDSTLATKCVMNIIESLEKANPAEEEYVNQLMQELVNLLSLCDLRDSIPLMKFRVLLDQDCFKASFLSNWKEAIPSPDMINNVLLIIPQDANKIIVRVLNYLKEELQHNTTLTVEQSQLTYFIFSDPLIDSLESRNAFKSLVECACSANFCFYKHMIHKYLYSAMSLSMDCNVFILPTFLSAMDSYADDKKRSVIFATLWSYHEFVKKELFCCSALLRQESQSVAGWLQVISENICNYFKLNETEISNLFDARAYAAHIEQFVKTES